MPDDQFEALTKGNGFMWQCNSCMASSARLDAAIKALEGKLTIVENRVNLIEEREKTTEARIALVENTANLAKQGLDQAKEDTSRAIFEEIREREDKKLNIVKHGVEEELVDSVEEAKRLEAETYNTIMAAIGVNSTFGVDITFARRLGARAPNRARPLLLGLKSETIRAEILSNAKKLAQTPHSLVSIVPDLTRRQREEDERVRKEAERKNIEELSEEDRRKNLRWVTVGRRGAKMLIKKEVRGVHSRPAVAVLNQRAPSTVTAEQQQMPPPQNKKRGREKEGHYTRKKSKSQVTEVDGATANVVVDSKEETEQMEDVFTGEP